MVMAFIAFLGFLAALDQLLLNVRMGYKTKSFLLMKSLDLVTITVPTALPTALAIGVTVAMERLKKK